MPKFDVDYNRFTKRWTLYFHDEVHTQIVADDPKKFSAYLEYAERMERDERRQEKSCRVAV